MRRLFLASLIAAVVLCRAEAWQAQKPDNSMNMLVECEDIAGCTELYFRGSTGYGEWLSGNRGKLALEKLDENSIQFSRHDESGTSPGLTAEYIGTRHGDAFGGTVSWTWPGHSSSGTTNWRALFFPGVTMSHLVETSQQKTGWLECESLDSSCNVPTRKITDVWNLRDRLGQETSLDGNSGSMQLTVEPTSKDSVVILRKDVSGPTAGLTAVFAGTRHGNVMSGGVTLYWFGHLQHPIPGGWSAFIPAQNYKCSSDATGLDGESALLLGSGLLILGLNQSALDCDLYAANKGDPLAQNTAGYLIKNGIGTKPDAAQAFEWWQKSAAQGNVNAARNLSVAYAKGEGTPPDDLKASYWADKATVWAHQDGVVSNVLGSGNLVDLAANLIVGVGSSSDDAASNRVKHDEAVFALMDQGKSREEAQSIVAEQEARQAAYKQQKEDEYQDCLSHADRFTRTENAYDTEVARCNHSRNQ